MNTYEGRVRITCSIPPGDCPEKLTEADYTCVNCDTATLHITDAGGNVLSMRERKKVQSSKSTVTSKKSEKPDVPKPAEKAKAAKSKVKK